MLSPRVIPCLLIQNNGLVKTIKFKEPKYLGDPLNTVRIFNEKEVDELIVLDIDASVQKKEPDYFLIAQLAAECRMPLCYGGGIKTVEQVERILSLGVEKVALSSSAVLEPTFLRRAAEVVGSQSISVVVDLKKTGYFSKHYQLSMYNGKKIVTQDPFEWIEKLAALGAGEVVVNFIDRDGTMLGYDLDTIKKIRAITDLPLTVLGGAGSFEHIKALIQAVGIVGAGVGSLFVFKGKYRAVLINYPKRPEKEALFVGMDEP